LCFSSEACQDEEEEQFVALALQPQQQTNQPSRCQLATKADDILSGCLPAENQ
jgi:hypothetical protein